MNKKHLQFLRWAEAGATLFSTCTKSQYTAILADSENFVLGIGYNGAPRNAPHCSEGACPRAFAPPNHKSSDYSDCIAVHAEANCLLHCDFFSRKQDGVTLYVNGEPCLDCAKLIANSGISMVVYMPENRPSHEKVREVLLNSNIDIVAYTADEVFGKNIHPVDIGAHNRYNYTE